LNWRCEREEGARVYNAPAELNKDDGQHGIGVGLGVVKQDGRAKRNK
jgi:hypothetical protein